MRLISYYQDGANPKAGILVGDKVVDPLRAGAAAEIDAPPGTVRGLLGLSSADRDRLGEAAAGEDGVDVGGVRLAPPVPDPQKILCIGLNYGAHAAEAEKEEPDSPIVFTKFRTSLLGSGEPIRLPAPNPGWIDWEGELAVVIGQRAESVAAAEALDHVAGYMPFNDLSARDLQLASPQWTMGKAFDGSGPCGPALVLADEVPDPQDLRLRTILNDEVVQEDTTASMIFSVAELVAYISSLITLETGDVIATGTPSGVGYARDPKRFLAPGDTIEVEIDGLGKLSNNVEES